MSENKIVIVSKDGKAEANILTGNSFHELNDLSTQTFIAENIPSFVKYVNECVPVENHPVFASSGKCVVVNQDEISRHSKAVALVKYEESSIVKRVKSITQQSNIHIEELEDLLKPLLAYGDTDMLKLYQFTRNCNIKSVSEIKRQIDDDGNYSMIVSRENQSDQKVRPVESFKMKLPIIEMHDEVSEFSFDVALTYKSSQQVKVFVTVSNFTFAEDVRRASIELVNRYLTGINQDRPIYNGVSAINEADDFWKYKSH